MEYKEAGALLCSPSGQSTVAPEHRSAHHNGISGVIEVNLER